MRKKFWPILIAFLFVLTITSAFRIDAKEENSEHVLNYKPSNIEVDVVGATKKLTSSIPGVKMEKEIPEAYDSRTDGLVPPVRKQGEYGTCWAFSAIAAVEGDLVKNSGRSAELINLSELHTAYFVFDDVTDLLGGISGDYIKLPASENYLMIGGTVEWGMENYVDWIGVAEETVAPYSRASRFASIMKLCEKEEKNKIASNASAFVRGYYLMNPKDQGAIKKMILEHGIVSMAYYCYDDDATSCYQDYEESANHAVAVVGWDDNYSKTNFATQPENDGAWLMRNSWGSQWGNNGYFWLSYEDPSICDVVAVDAVDKTSDTYSTLYYEHNYQYDGGHSQEEYSTSSDYIQQANVFTAQGKEEIKAVGFTTYKTEQNYQIYIFKNPSADKPDSGELLSKQSGSTSYAGYYTVSLNQTVGVQSGDTFSVIIQWGKDSSGMAHCFYDMGKTYTNLEYLSSANAGQSFLRRKGVALWTDISRNNENNCIKAFTNSINEKQLEDLQGIVPIEYEDVTGIPVETPTPTIVPYLPAQEVNTGGTINPSPNPNEVSKMVKAPGKTKITKAKRISKNRLQLSFKKIKKAERYEIKISTSKKFTKKKTKTSVVRKNSAILKKVSKKKTYYVKIRAFCLDSNGKKVYGKYCTIKKIKK